VPVKWSAEYTRPVFACNNYFKDFASARTKTRQQAAANEKALAKRCQRRWMRLLESFLTPPANPKIFLSSKSGR